MCQSIYRAREEHYRHLREDSAASGKNPDDYIWWTGKTIAKTNYHDREKQLSVSSVLTDG